MTVSKQFVESAADVISLVIQHTSMVSRHKSGRIFTNRRPNARPLSEHLNNFQIKVNNINSMIYSPQ